MSKHILLLLLSAFLFWDAEAQSDYVFKITFANKTGTSHTLVDPSTYLSPRAIQHRHRYQITIDSLDLPVSDTYLDAILALGSSTLHGSSRWLNAAYFVTADSSSFVASVDTLDYITSIENVAYYPGGYGDEGFPSEELDELPDLSGKTYNYGNGIGPMNLHNAKTLHLRDFTGKGMLIAVLDNGYQDVDQNASMSHLYSNNQIKGTKNFVRPTLDVYSTGYHGTRMVSLLAALDEGRLVGTAPDADYILIVSEDSRSEKRIEVENMVMAMEFADSMGADVISSSIGYNTFDNPADDYSISDLDGKTCSASIAATIAARKGIIVVTSAGNENAKPWNHILFPADADSILAVGSAKADKSWAFFSARGPSADGRVKPDVCSLSEGVYTISRGDQLLLETGSSMAVPMIAGLTACLMGMDTTRNPQDYVSLIREYSNHFSSPRTDLGYGIPNFGSLAYLLDIPFRELDDNLIATYPNPVTGDLIQFSSDPDIKLNSVLILDATGRMISEKNIQPGISELPSPKLPGNYTLIFKTDNGFITKFLVKL